MRLKAFILCASLCLFNAALWAAGPANPAADFTISNPSHIPGATLEPGSYTIHVVNRLSDRVILKVDSTKGDLHSTFIGIPNSEIQKPASSGPVKWANPADGSQYLKGWYFPGSASVVEFVYPKARAMELAQETKTIVLYTPVEITPEVTVVVKSPDEPVVVQLKQAPVMAINPREKKYKRPKSLRNRPQRQL